VKSFKQYLRLRENLTQDIGSAFTGDSSPSADEAESAGTFVELAKEIWKIDQPGMMHFFQRYADDPKAEDTKIPELIDALRNTEKSSLNRFVSKEKRSDPFREKDQIVPPIADGDGSEMED